MYLLQLDNSHPEETLSYDMGKLLERKILTDVTFAVGKKGTHFHAHSLILENRCPSLAHVVDKHTKKKKGGKKGEKKDKKESSGNVSTAAPEVTVDVEPAVFEELLYFIYTGEVTTHISFSLLSHGSSSSESFSLEQVFALMSLAIEHELPRLIALCERKIRSAPKKKKKSNVINILIN